MFQTELKQLGALKKNTSLSALQKVEEVRKLGVSFDERIRPLLDAEQQQKFEAMREQLRRRMIESIADDALRKLRGGVATWFADVHK